MSIDKTEELKLYHNIGNNIKYYRLLYTLEKGKLTQESLAEKIDVSLENGKIIPQATVVFIIPWQKKKRKGKK